MRVLHLNAGNETGGGMYYLLRILSSFVQVYPHQFVLGVLEKKELYRRAKVAKIPVVNFSGRGKLNVNMLRKIIRFIKDEKITHVHTHGPRANVLMNLLHRFVKVQWIVTVHSDPTIDFSEDFWKHRLYTPLHLNALKNAHRIISVCEAFYPTLIKYGVLPTKLINIPNGINFNENIKLHDYDREVLFAKQGIKQDDFLMVQVARLEHVKGHQYAFEALARLLKKGRRNIHLLLVGDGTIEDQLRQLAQTLYIKDHVHFLGNRSEEEVASFYHLADITLLTSISESFPYVLLEAARAKKPVIATNVGDIARLINDIKFGWLVEPKNSVGLSEAIDEAILLEKNKQLYLRGEQLFRYAKNNFSLHSCVQSIYDVYNYE